MIKKQIKDANEKSGYENITTEEAIIMIAVRVR
jgi:hypothetical protein